MRKLFIMMVALTSLQTLCIAQTNTFPSSGNVGIGITSPATTLHVQGSTSTTVTIGGTSSSPADANIFFRTGSTKYGWLLGAQNNINNAFEITPSTITGGVTFNTPALAVLQSGNIGIGTNSPGALLTLASSGYIGWDNGSGTIDASLFKAASGIIRTGSRFDITNGSGVLTDRIAQYNSTYLTIGNGSNDIYLASSVGIGTTDPQGYKLAVNGNMIAESVKVKLNSNWPDHVFEPTYKLPDLRETEQFIKENKHLPEIPSAKEVQEMGINLGEMNAKLLQKIEELTLYVIELKKDNDQMKTKMKINRRHQDEF